MNNQSNRLLSRRAFAKHAALISASAGIASNPLIFPSNSSAAEPESIQAPDNLPKLSAEGQSEAEARYQLALSRYGSRLNEEQKKSAKFMCYTVQPGLERLRSFALQNGDVPALFLRPLVEREKQPGIKASSGLTGAAKKS
ncbi:MAG TPA: twin-arginine translocation signal domain-containing protein [Candidatus Acidoferrum sp.]|jgi:hypothetical protein